MKKSTARKVFVGATAGGWSSVQRGAHEAYLPQQEAEWPGEPTTDEGANATESAPKRTVVVGGRRPAAKQSAAPLCEHHLKVMAERSEEVGHPDRGVRQRTQAARCRRQIAAQPSQRGAALCAGGPEGGVSRLLEERSDERQTEMCMQGVQPCKSSEIHASGSADGRLDGACLCAQDAGFSASGAVTRF